MYLRVEIQDSCINSVLLQPKHLGLEIGSKKHVFTHVWDFMVTFFFFFPLHLKCMSTAVLIFQGGLERAITFTDSKLVLYFISCTCFSFPAVLMTYGVYPASALKQVFQSSWYRLQILINFIKQFIHNQEFVFCAKTWLKVLSWHSVRWSLLEFCNIAGGKKVLTNLEFVSFAFLCPQFWAELCFITLRTAVTLFKGIILIFPFCVLETGLVHNLGNKYCHNILLLIVQFL